MPLPLLVGVVGGGKVGVSTALALGRQGHTAYVFDQVDELAAGARFAMAD